MISFRIQTLFHAWGSQQRTRSWDYLNDWESLSHYRLIYCAGISAHSVLLPLLYGGVGRSTNSAVATWSVCLVDKGRNSELGAGLSWELQQHREWDLRIPVCLHCLQKCSAEGPAGEKGSKNSSVQNLMTFVTLMDHPWSNLILKFPVFSIKFLFSSG